MHFDLIDLRLYLHTLDTGNITAGAARSHLSLAAASGMRSINGDRNNTNSKIITPAVTPDKRPPIAIKWLAAYGLIFGVAMWALINLGIEWGVPPGTAALPCSF